MKYLAPFLLTLIVLVSCNKEDQPPIINPVVPTLDFGDFKLDDEMMFLRFESSCEDFQGDFRFTGDTLNWSVTAMEGQAGILSEKFTDGSPLAADFEQVDVSVTASESGSNSNYILMPDRWSSNLFFFYGNDTLWVDPAASVDLAQDNCQLTVDGGGFRGDAIASIQSFKVPGYQFDNMTVVSCVPGSVSDAYIIYSDGQIKAIYNIDWFSGIPTGWIAL